MTQSQCADEILKRAQEQYDADPGNSHYQRGNGKMSGISGHTRCLSLPLTPSTTIAMHDSLSNCALSQSALGTGVGDGWKPEARKFLLKQLKLVYQNHPHLTDIQLDETRRVLTACADRTHALPTSTNADKCQSANSTNIPITEQNLFSLWTP